MELLKRNKITVTIFVWFLLQAVYFATFLRDGIGPDEKYHVEVAEMYRNTPGFEISAEHVPPKYGPLVREPYLFHLLMGKLLHLRPSGQNPFLFLRLVNVLFSGLGFLALAWALSRLSLPKPARILVLMLAVSTLMFTFLAGMVNYDNLAHPLMYLGFALLVGLYQRFTLPRFLSFLLVLLAGCLTKVTFLPMTLIFLATAGYLGRRYVGRVAFWQDVSWNWRLRSLLGGVLVLGALNVSLYGGNLLHYGGVRASCDAIYTKPVCDKKYYFSRRYNETVARTAGIPRWSFTHFHKEYWKEIKVQALGVIGAEQVRIRDRADRWPYRVVFGAFVIGILYSLMRGRDFFRQPVWWWCLAATLAYSYFILVMNFRYYLEIGQFGLALQARYLFPVLPLFYLVIAMPIFHHLRGRAGWWVCAGLSCSLLFGGFWIFHTVVVSPEWYR